MNSRAGRDARGRADAYDSLIVLGLVRGTAEGLEAATEFARRALTAREGAFGKSDLETARSLSTLATVLDYRGDWTEAESLERRSLAIRRAAVGARDTLVALSLRQLGAFAFWQGRAAEAESLYRSALAVYDVSNFRPASRVVDLWLNLSEALRVQERYAEARGALVHGLTIADSALAREDPLRASLVNNLAGLYKDEARYLDAEPLLVEVLVLQRAAEPPDPYATIVAELNLAEVYRLQGRMDEAGPHYESALALARRVFGSDNPNVLPSLNQAAVFLRESGDLERASTLAKEALDILARTVGEEHPLTAQSLNDLGELELAAGRSRAADSLARRAIAIRARTLGPTHVDVAISRLLLARALAADDATAGSAHAELDRATAVLDASRVEPEARLVAAELAAELAGRRGHPEAARPRIERAIADAESLRVVRGVSATSRATFLARHLRLYDRLFWLCLADSDVDGAFETHERARARLMLDQLSSAGVDFYSSLEPALAERLRATENQARTGLVRVQAELSAVRVDPALEDVPRREREAALEAARDSAAAEVVRARDAARAASPLWRQQLTRGGQPVALAEVQRALVPQGEYLLIYHLGAEASAALLIPPAPGAPRAFSLIADPNEAALLRIAPGPLRRRDVAAIIEGGRTSRGSRIGLGLASWLSGVRTDPLRVPRPGESDADSTVHRLRALHRVLVPDVVWKDLRRAKAVTVVVDGALHALPFETLVTAPPGKSTRDWLDQGPVLRYGSSATSLVMLARREPLALTAGAPACLSVSNPDFGSAASESARGRSWSPLPATERESEAVRAAFAPKPVTVLSRGQATEAAVRAVAGHVPYLHLATHGFVTERRGDVLAGVVLAKPDAANAVAEDDGLLQIYEIYDLRLGASLAVLSACETQRGPAVEGEGVFALSRAFQVAGARSVIATQWPVDDAATADLIGDCFRRIAGRKPADPAVALRDAKRALRARADRRDPFYWAAFTLSGNDRAN